MSKLNLCIMGLPMVFFLLSFLSFLSSVFFLKNGGSKKHDSVLVSTSRANLQLASLLLVWAE